MLQPETPQQEQTPAIERRPPSYLRRVIRPVAGTKRQWWQTPRKWAAVVIWMFACVTTWQSVAAVLNDFTSSIAVILLATLTTQALLTIGESAFWRGKWWHLVPLGSVIADTIINTGGLWPLVARLDRLPFWQNLADVFNLQPGMRPLPTVVLSVLFGFLLAAAPEYIWRDE